MHDSIEWKLKTVNVFTMYTSMSKVQTSIVIYTNTNLRLRVDETDSMFVDGDQQDLWEVGLCSLLKTREGLMLCDNNVSVDHVSYIVTFTCRAVISPCKSDVKYFHLR